MPREFTVSITRQETYREGWGVYVEPLFDDDDEGRYGARVSNIYVEVVRIARYLATIEGGAACVPASTSYVPIDLFQEVDDLTVDDTHDLRSRYFETEQEARDHADHADHADYTVKRFHNPSPWESFVKLS